MNSQVCQKFGIVLYILNILKKSTLLIMMWRQPSLLHKNVKTDPFLAVILRTIDLAKRISYFWLARLVKRVINSFALLYKINLPLANFTIASKSRLARTLIWTHDINTVAVRGTIVFAWCTLINIYTRVTRDGKLRRMSP